MCNVVGHQQTVTLLRNSLERDALSHAYLLVGPPHVGKMTVATRLAQALNCEAAERPCTECIPCRKIAAMTHADVQVIGLPSNGSAGDDKPQTVIGIDQILEAQHAASLPPFEGKSKVFIIDGAELLSTEASNCLLKTLEEPADRVVFLLLTSTEKALLPTVVSRCQRLDLAPLSGGEVEATLQARGVESGTARLLARLCHGCLGWAIGAAGNSRVLEQRQQELELIVDVVRSGYEERFAYAARLATRFGQSRETVQDTLALWIEWWRDLLLAKTGCRERISNIDREDYLVEMSAAYRLAQIRGFIGRLQSARLQLRQNANARLVLEVLMLSIPETASG